VSTRTLRGRPTRRRNRGAFASVRDPLYRSGYALVANTAATTAVGIVYWAVAAHVYDRQALGRSSALVAALILVSSFAQLNLANTLPRFIPKAGPSAGKLIAYSYGVSSLAALAFGLAFVTILPRLSSHWQFVSNSALLSFAFVASAAVWGVFALQDVALLSLHRPILVPVENFVYGVCKLLMLVGIAWALPMTGIFVSWVIPLAITVPAVNWLIFHRYLRERDYPVLPSGLRVREVAHFAFVDYLGSALSQASGNLLPLLVLSTLGAAANGSFYIAWTITSGLGLVATNFGTSLLVEGSAAPGRLAELTRGVLARCLVITSLGAALLILAARPILEIYGSGYAAHASSLLGLLAVGTVPSCLIVIAISLDRILGRVGRATLTRLVLTVLVLGGSWLLVRKVGIAGVAFAWAGANLVVALARLPTIVGAARRRAPLGRHRAGTPRADRVDQAERSGYPPRPLAPLAAPSPALKGPPDPRGDTARALELLMSLGIEVPVSRTTARELASPVVKRSRGPDAA
jgi:O-antigen/teichoic acid export membrane protein